MNQDGRELGAMAAPKGERSDTSKERRSMAGLGDSPYSGIV